MSLFKGKRVAFSGTIDSGVKTRIVTYLKQSGATILIYASVIDFLIVGADYLEKYKYKSCRAHVLPAEKVLETIPEIPTNLWVDRYRPRALSELIGQKTAVGALTEWLANWGKDADAPKAALVTGPPGIGKTTAVHLIVRNAGYELIELNASNERSASAIRGWFDEALRSQCVGQRRVVVMDEVDGMSSGDRGGIGELGRVTRACSFPIICIANERTPRMRPLSSYCLDIRFTRPTRVTIACALMPIVKEHRINMTSGALETLCENNGNDIRSILNFLQFSSRVSVSGPAGSGSGPAGSGEKDELLRIDTFSATGRLFGKGGSLDARTNLVFVDFGMVPLMVAEGYVGAAAKSGGTDLERLLRCSKAADYLGDWDILDSRIRRTQSWNLLPAATVAIAGAAYSAQGSAPFQIFPSWLGKNSKRLKHMRNLREMRRLQGGVTTESLLDRLHVVRPMLLTCGSALGIVGILEDLNMTRDDLDTVSEITYEAFEKEYVMEGKLKSAVTREWKKRHPADSAKKTGTEEPEEEIDIESDVDLDI